MSGWRSHLALASVAIALLTFLLGAIVTSGGLPGMKASCGDFGLRCLGNGIIALAAGCLLGLGTAIASTACRWRRWPSWRS
jgi:hypothetical protein